MWNICFMNWLFTYHTDHLLAFTLYVFDTLLVLFDKLMDDVYLWFGKFSLNWKPSFPFCTRWFPWKVSQNFATLGATDPDVQPHHIPDIVTGFVHDFKETPCVIFRGCIVSSEIFAYWKNLKALTETEQAHRPLRCDELSCIWKNLLSTLGCIRWYFPHFRTCKSGASQFRRDAGHGAHLLVCLRRAQIYTLYTFVFLGRL